ncbi:MAG: hypothetical protein GX876_09165 [Bacteroidales bacterium]|nr:hypothetical protein [Bacteroidales bacterium]
MVAFTISLLIMLLDMKVMGTGSHQEATKIQTNVPVDAKYFVIPKNIEFSDMPILNQRWEYYRPPDINLSSFNASLISIQYDYSNSRPGFDHEVTTIRNKSPLKRQIPEKEYLLRSNTDPTEMTFNRQVTRKRKPL